MPNPIFQLIRLRLHQSVNTHIRQMTCHLYYGNIELNMDAKSHFVNTIFCVIFVFCPFFSEDLFRVQYININEKCQIYITISYVCPLHYICMKYRVLCLNVMTFDCMGHSFLRKGREGFPQSIMGNHDTPWSVQLSTAAFFSLGTGETTSLYSFRLESVCFFAKHLSLTSFSDPLRFFKINLS